MTLQGAAVTDCARFGAGLLAGATAGCCFGGVRFSVDYIFET